MVSFFSFCPSVRLCNAIISCQYDACCRNWGNVVCLLVQINCLLLDRLCKLTVSLAQKDAKRFVKADHLRKWGEVWPTIFNPKNAACPIAKLWGSPIRCKSDLRILADARALPWGVMAQRLTWSSIRRSCTRQLIVTWWSGLMWTLWTLWIVVWLEDTKVKSYTAKAQLQKTRANIMNSACRPCGSPWTFRTQKRCDWLVAHLQDFASKMCSGTACGKMGSPKNSGPNRFWCVFMGIIQQSSSHGINRNTQSLRMSDGFVWK